MRKASKSLLYAAAFGVAVTVAGHGALAADPKVKIGQLAEFTGLGADVYGPPVDKGIQMALDEISKTGYLKDVAELELTTVDDASDTTTAITQFNKLVQAGNTIILESAITPINAAIAPIAKSRGVLHIGVVSAGTSANPADFIHLTDSVGPMQSLAEYAIKTMKAKRIGVVIDTTNAAFGGMRTGFVAGLAAAGASDAIVTTQSTRTSESDYSTILTNLLEAKVDTIVTITTGADSGNFIKQMKQRNGFADVKVLGQTAWTPLVHKIAGTGAVGAVFPQQWIPPAAGTETGFAAEYKAKFKENSGVYAALAHDAIWLIAIALKETKKRNEPLDGKSARAYVLSASETADFAKYGLVKGIKFLDDGHPRVPGLMATFDEQGNIVPAK